MKQMYDSMKNILQPQYDIESLLLITDLEGQIINASGNTMIIKETVRSLLGKNFIENLLTTQTRLRILYQAQSTLMLKKNVHYTQFTTQFNLPPFRTEAHNQKFNVKCYRTIIRLDQLEDKKKANIKVVKAQSQFDQILKQKDIKQAVLVYIEPIAQLQSAQNSFDSQAKKDPSKTNQQRLSKMMIYKQEQEKLDEIKDKSDQQLDYVDVSQAQFQLELEDS